MKAVHCIFPSPTLKRHCTATSSKRCRRSSPARTAKSGQQLTDLCGAMVDAQNVTRILRLKQFFHASPDAIRAQLLPSGGTLSRRMQEADDRCGFPR